MTERRFNPTAARGSHAAKLGKVFLDEPGHYAIRLAKGAPEVAATVLYRPTPDPSDPSNPMDRPYYWELWADGRLHRGPNKEKEAGNVAFTTSGRRITEEEHRYLLADRAWARTYAPHLPEANPHRKTPLRSVDPESLF